MKKNSLSKLEIVRSGQEFRGLLRNSHINGMVYRIEDWIVYRDPGSSLRLGISISRKVMKRAHERNQLKRWLREWFRHQKAQLKGSYLFRLSRPPKKATWGSVILSLQVLLSSKLER